MSAMWQILFSNTFFNENDYILINISVKIVLIVLISNATALAQVIAWCRIGDNLLFEPIVA